MTPIIHDVPLITQGIQNCVQASAAQLLNFYGIPKTVSDVQKEVPVYIKDGVPLGTSLGHIAKYFIDLGFRTTIHTTDIQIFDRSWSNLDNSQLIEKLTARLPHLKHPLYDQDTLKFIVDGYVQYLQNNGKITCPIVDGQYLCALLQKGPVFGVVSFNFLNNAPKYSFDIINNKPYPDEISGNTSTHAVIIAGYDNGKYLVVDPDYDFGGKKWIDESRLIGAFYLAGSDFDNLLITLEK